MENLNVFSEWYLTRDSYGKKNASQKCLCFPAQLTGIIKIQGCCIYTATHSQAKDDMWGMYLTPRWCKKLFGCFPKGGELIYVKWTGRKWKSEKIDLEFSK